MTNIDQLNSSLASELRVKPENFDREGNLVSDALAGTVAAGKEFEVGRVVVLPVAVDVVDGFFIKERTTKFAGHNISMFQDATLLSGYPSWNRNPKVSVTLLMGGVFTSVKLFSKLLDLALLSAFDAAILLLSVDRFSARAPKFEKFLVAVQANSFVAHVSGFLAASRRTLHRAVHRVFVVLLPIGIQVAPVHGERTPTFLTGELDGGEALDLPTMNFLPSVKAVFLAKSLLRISRSYGKRIAALLTHLVDRHIKPLVAGALQNRPDYAMFCDVGQHF